MKILYHNNWDDFCINYTQFFKDEWQKSFDTLIKNEYYVIDGVNYYPDCVTLFSLTYREQKNIRNIKLPSFEYNDSYTNQITCIQTFKFYGGNRWIYYRPLFSEDFYNKWKKCTDDNTQQNIDKYGSLAKASSYKIVEVMKEKIGNNTYKITDPSFYSCLLGEYGVEIRTILIEQEPFIASMLGLATKLLPKDNDEYYYSIDNNIIANIKESLPDIFISETHAPHSNFSYGILKVSNKEKMLLKLFLD